VAYGIHYNLSPSLFSGWAVQYDEPYSHYTKAEHIYTSGTSNCVMVGAQLNSVITIAAFGTGSVIAQATSLNTPHAHRSACFDCCLRAVEGLWKTGLIIFALVCRRVLVQD